MDNKPHDFRDIWCSACGHHLTVPIRCKNRFCAICGPVRRARVRRRMDAILNDLRPQKPYAYKFLTLTQASGTSATACCRSITAAFRRLRSRNIWKENVQGGLYVIEATWGEAGWHIHIHAVIVARFIPQRLLARAWQMARGGRILDIRKVRSRDITGYLTKYLTADKLPDDRREELSDALKDARLFSAFGVCHDLLLRTKPAKPGCPRCGSHDWATQWMLDRALPVTSCAPG